MYNSWANHTICGAEMAYEDLSKMGMSKKSLERIKWYVAMHMKPGEILFSKKEKRSLKIKKILSDVGLDVTLNLLDLTVADRYGQYNPLQSPAIDDVYTLKALVQEIHDTE